MKLESNSKILLSITKSKAKMYEFGIDEEHHIALPISPQNLLIFTIGILGELAAHELRQSDDDIETKLQLKTQLIEVGQYFDALNMSNVVEDLTNYLKLVGSSAYYLADMPGSSLVLAKDLEYEIERLTDSYIEAVLVWLLKSDIDNEWYYIEDSYLLKNLEHFVDAYKGFFVGANEIESVVEVAINLRNEVYTSGSDRELLFVDVLIAIAINKIHNSSRVCLEKFTNIDTAAWEGVLGKNDFIKEFWPAQRLLGEQGVFTGKSAVVQMPTSAGKTKSIELIIRSAFLSGRANFVVVVAPFRALCREITSTFKKVFEGEAINVNELRDIIQVNESEKEFIKFLLGEDEFIDTPKHTIMVTTPEKLVYLLRHEPALASEIGLLIFDEGHQFDSGKRGITYELLVATLKKSINEYAQKVLISAVMANARSIGDWLNGESGVEIQGSQCLPTIRSVAFTSWQTKLGQLRYLDQDKVEERGYFVPRVIEQINLGTRGQEINDRLFPEKNNNSSMAAFLGIKLCHQGPVAIFCGAKNTVTSISNLIVDYYNRGLEIPEPRLSSDQDELNKISYLANLHFNNKIIFPESIKLGILPHSANIPNGLRVSVEWAMENNKACLVVCTSTLAQGVNLPIKYLIISNTFQAGKEISTRDFHNLIGRAGRSGYHTEGSVIFADSDIYDKRATFNDGWRWARAIHLLDFVNAEDCLSSLKELISQFLFQEIQVNVIDFITDPTVYRNECIRLSLQHNIDVSSLLIEMDYKEDLIQTIESYFLSYLKDNPDIADDTLFVELAEQTLAFYLANEEEKIILVDAFKLISKRVLNIDKSKYSYYGKTLLGVKKLLEIESWIDANIFELEFSVTSEDFLRSCWPLIKQLSNNKLMIKLEPSNLLIEFSIRWISGASYHELFDFMKDNDAFYRAKSVKRKIQMDHIIDFADRVLGFDSMLFIGALADVLEGRDFNDEIIDNLRLLQSKLKLGLANKLDLWLYDKGYVDREVCKLISQMLVENGVNADRINYRVLNSYQEDIENILLTLPSYFSHMKEN